MRSIIFISIFLCSVSNTNTKNTTLQLGKLDGTWVPVKQEIGGKPLPQVVFEHQKLIMNDSTYMVIAESIDKGIVKYTEEKMDIYGKEGVNAGKHFTAIYKYENGQLTICYNLSGDNYPGRFDTKDRPMFFLSVYKKN